MAMDEKLDFDLVDPFAAVAPAIVVRRSGILREQDEDRLKDVENELLEKSLFTLEASVSFSEIAPDAEEPPEAWIKELGAEEAHRKFRIARSSWMAKKDSPVGIDVAKSIAVGILRNKAMTGGTPGSLTVGTVNMVVVAQAYPELELNPDGD